MQLWTGLKVVRGGGKGGGWGEGQLTLWESVASPMSSQRVYLEIVAVRKK